MPPRLSLNPQNKWCFKCRMEKPRSGFHRNKAAWDGLNGLCKECACAKSRAVMPLQRARESYKERHRQERKQYDAKYPEKVRARQLAQKVVVPNYCEQCRAEGVQLHKHHPDYSKPTEVIALCIPCHAIIHKQIQESR